MYLGVAHTLDLEPCEVMMVASHKHDLRAAKKHGLKTAFIQRPHEFGKNNNPHIAREPEFTMHAANFSDLADQVGT